MIFQASLDQGAQPNIWKTAKVVSIFKKGNKSDPCNYRRTCICCKILEHIVYLSISDHLTSFNILCDEQHGYRHKSSCETQVISTIYLITLLKVITRRVNVMQFCLTLVRLLITSLIPCSTSSSNIMVLMELFYYG